MYDHTNPTHRAEARAELVGNRAYYGPAGDVKGVLAKLHDMDASRSPDPGRTIYGITGLQFGAATVTSTTEYDVVVNNRNRQAYVDRLVGMGEVEIPENQYAQILTLFDAVTSPTIHAALLHRRKYQCEFMWGDGSIITPQQYRELRGAPDPVRLMNPTEQNQYVQDVVDRSENEDGVRRGPPDDPTVTEEKRAAAITKAPTKQAPGQSLTWS